MRKNSKLPQHVKNYIKAELYDYVENKMELEKLQQDILFSSSANDGQPKSKNQISNPTEQKAEKLITSRSILIVTDKINKIDRALAKLNKSDKEIVELIFQKGYSQIYAQMHCNITKDMYYNAMNKIIYLTAIEYGEI